MDDSFDGITHVESFPMSPKVKRSHESEPDKERKFARELKEKMEEERQKKRRRKDEIILRKPDGHADHEEGETPAVDSEQEKVEDCDDSDQVDEEECKQAEDNTSPHINIKA